MHNTTNLSAMQAGRLNKARSSCRIFPLVLQVTHTHTTIQWPLVRDYPGRLVPEETFTHSHPSCSSDILYQLPPSTTIHSILLVQFKCLTVLFHNLSPGPLLSSSWSWAPYFILHAFLHPIIIFFRNTCPYHRSCSAVIPMLCHLFLIPLSAPYLEICLSA